jgi:ABC-2 type transport system permease protein
MKVVAIVRTNLVRSFRDRLALFFSVLLPLILILVLGLTFGAGASTRIGVVNLDRGSLAADLVDSFAAAREVSVDIRAYDTPGEARDDASRGIVSAAVIIAAGYSESLANGGRSEVTVLTPPTQRASAVRTMIDEAIAREVSAVRVAQWASSATGQPFAPALAAARARSETLPGVAVVVEPVKAAARPIGAYGGGAQSQLVLFMFLTSLTGSVELVVTRQLGISRRMFATPTSPWTIICGEGLARVAFAVAQGLFIVLASAVLFGVSWGDPIAVGVIIVVYAVVAGGASMIVGSVASTPSQAGAIGPAIGMLLALLGGAMVPLEVFPSVMQTVARLTPHAWAMDALGAVVNAGAGIDAVLPQLGVLVAFAGLFFLLAVLRFRQTLVAPA